MNCSFKSLLAALILLCSTVATAHDFEVGGIFYNITSSTEKTVAVTYRDYSFDAYSNEYTGDVTVPSTVAYNGNTYSVTSIGYCAFYGCSGLTSVTIGDGVTSIEYGAFYGCSGLKSVTIGDGVTSIGIGAFNDCYGLTSIEIPGSVTSIENLAFSHCSGLKSIVVDDNNRHYDSREGCNAIIETATNNLVVGCKNTVILSSVTSIGDGAFSGCDGLTSIEIPGNVTSIGGYAFSDCEGLTSVTIGDGVTSIGNLAFYGCSCLTSIEIPGSVTSIGWSAFRGCSSLTSIEIPGSVTSIGNYTFEGCTGLTSVTIGFGVTSIGQYAFKGCSGLTSVTIPNSVTSIGDNAFEGCSGLKTVINLSSFTFSKGSTDCGYVAYYADKVINVPNGFVEGDFVFGIFYGKITLCGYIGNGGNITLPENFNGESYVMGPDVFKNNTAITSITIPDGVTSIGNYAFEGCSGLTSVTIGDGVTSIGEEAFQWCSGLTSVTSLATTAPALGTYAFSGIYSGATLYYPAGSDYSSWAQYFANTEEITEEFPEEEEVFGDLNGDGTVSVSDIQVLVNLILSDAAAEDNPAADANGDGKISVSDIQVVVNRILGKY